MTTRLARLLLALMWVAPAAAITQDSSFTYQGELRDGTTVVTGLPNLEFRLFDDPVNGAQIGDPIVAPAYPVLDGLVTIDLDFGPVVFNGEQRWLEIRVEGTPLLPRQRITSTPYATRALSVNANSVTSAQIGDGTIAAADIDSSQVQRRVDTFCPPGASIRAIAATGLVTCEADDLGGDITAVSPGSGLSGGGTSGDVTLSIGTGAVTSTHLAGQSVGIAQIKQTEVQGRVTSNCAVGSAIRQVNADGTVFCQALPTLPTSVSAPRPVYARSSIDLPGEARDMAMTIGVDGLALVSYHDSVNGDLRVAHCSDFACTAATDTLIDATGIVGEYSAIAINRVGLAVISYYDRSNGDLKLARCVDITCSSANISVVDGNTGVDVGQYSAVAINMSGFAAIAYYDVSNGDLKVAICNNDACSAPSLVVADPSGNDVGRGASISVFPSGGGPNIHVSYYDATTQDLKLMRCASNNCASPLNAVVDANGDAGSVSTLLAGVDGKPLIIYAVRTGADHEIKAAKCDVVYPCTGATISTIAVSLGSLTQLTATIGDDDLPLIARYSSQSARVKFYRCADAACASSLEISENTSGGFMAEQSQMSLTIGIDGFPLLAHRATGGNLGLLHCSDRSCSPYRRGR